MVSDEQLIQDLKDFADELGETPSIRQMREDGSWSARTYKNHFETWNEALKQAGLEPVEKRSNSKEELLEDLQQLADELGETPSKRQMSEGGPWSADTYENHFETWNEALKQAGFEVKQKTLDSKQNLVQDLRVFTDKLGETPTKEQMENKGPWGATTYYTHFGGWNKALREAGFEPTRQYAHSKQELLEDLREFADKLGETPTKEQMENKGPWSATTYQRRFESWNEALKEAGLEPVEKRSDSKEELLKDLQEFADELGEIPSQRQMKDKGPWSKSVYKRRFGSWNQALKEAGFEPIREHPVEPAWGDDVDDYYGESWPEMREKVVQRDDEQCRVCSDDGLLNVHHITPRRYFEVPDDSNTLDNLITLCASCHGRFENRWTDTDPEEFETYARELLSVA